MSRPRSVKSTDGELEIPQILWRIKIGTIRDAHDELVKVREVGQQAIATMMQLMHKKELLTIVDDRRPAKYALLADSAATNEEILKDLTKQSFGGSVTSLITHLLHARNHSSEKRARLDRLLDELE